MILHHQKESSAKSPLFRAATFICATLLFSRAAPTTTALMSAAFLALSRGKNSAQGGQLLFHRLYSQNRTSGKEAML